jgi:hypothetical protein
VTVDAESRLGASSAGFGLAATIIVVFNTVLACVKDAWRPLLNAMNAVGYHNWITQGVVDVILFFVLGLLFSRTGFAARMAPNRLISTLVAAVVLAGAGLFMWYVLF